MRKLALILACFCLTTTGFAQEIVQAMLTHERPVINYSMIEFSVKVYAQQPGTEEVTVLEIPADMMLRVEADMQLNPPDQFKWRQNRMTIRGDVIVSAKPLDQVKSGGGLEQQFVNAPLRMELRDAVVLLERQ